MKKIRTSCRVNMLLLSFIGLFITSLYSPVYASTEIVIDEELQFEFAEHCFNRGDYAAAIIEYDKFVYFFPFSEKNELARFKTGLSYRLSNQYDRAIKVFYSLIDDYGDTRYSFRSYIEISRAYLLKKAYSRSLTVLNNLITIASDRAILDEAYYEKAWIYMEMGLWNRASDCLKEISPKNQDIYRVKEIVKGLDKKNEIKRKDPKLAGFLSILPGAGHLYCERPKDALLSFILNGAMIFAAYEAFDNDLYGIGGIMTFLELGFYSGNIYSAISSAHKFNRDEKSRFLERIKKVSRRGISMGAHEKERSVFILCRIPF